LRARPSMRAEECRSDGKRFFPTCNIVQDTTLIAVRPDGYVGLRCDGDHLNALERYRGIVHSGRA
jgi:hypothetical protein